jgi:hypothetical protein
MRPAGSPLNKSSHCSRVRRIVIQLDSGATRVASASQHRLEDVAAALVGHSQTTMTHRYTHIRGNKAERVERMREVLA